MRKFALPVVIFVASILVASLNYWSLLDSTLARLRSKGEFGLFMASMLTSPLLPIVLSFIGLALVANEIYGHRGVVEARPLGKRRLVSVQPEYLMSLFEDRTHAQAKKLLRDYVGQWMQVSGPLNDVRSIPFGFRLVSISYQKYRLIFLFFAPSWRKRLTLLRPKEYITVIGRISDADGRSVSLNRCQLAETSRNEFFKRHQPDKQ